ncbi:hypothetical protein Aco03nite_052480 [Actinoplanes couchii]|uniref:Uncharacterized protein n=1 Tax=Actinoplanes couchii TaxID=403638 RepID=A0ABQ3XEB2_9ACTN|nr:hypothetical protein Aco03nite_052480 [Actinoplanes couchii]
MRAVVAQHRGDLCADQPDDGVAALVRAEAGQLLDQPGGGLGAGHRGPARGPDQAAQPRRDVTAGPQHRQVETDRQQHRVGTGQGRVEQRDALLGGERRGARPGQALQVGLGQRAGHPGRRRPRSPPEGQSIPSLRTA